MPHENPEADPLEARGPASPSHTGADHAEAAAAGRMTQAEALAGALDVVMGVTPSLAAAATLNLDPTLARRAIRDTLGKVNQLLLRQDCYDLTPWEEGASWERVISHLLEAKSLAMRARNKVADQLAPPPAPEEDFSAALASGQHQVRTIVPLASLTPLAAALAGIPSTYPTQRPA